MLSYANSYSGYAALRETFMGSENGDANAFIALADSKNLVMDKKLVTNAAYTGVASYSMGGKAPITTDLLTMTVADDSISGYVYRTTTTGRGDTKTRTYVQFKDAAIKAANGVVGFAGDAMINTSPSQIAGLVPTEASILNGKEVSGSYQGVFAGPNAEEVAGTFETNADAATSVRGAFAGAK